MWYYILVEFHASSAYKDMLLIDFHFWTQQIWRLDLGIDPCL